MSARPRTFEPMFDRAPDVTLVADLLASSARPAPASAESSAAALIEELTGWQRVASWVEWHRLDAMRRFEAARTEADRDLASSSVPDEPGKSPSQLAAIARLEASLEQSAGRFAAEEIALALNVSVTSVDRQLRLARDLHTVHRDLGDALELGDVSGFVAAMVAQATRKLPESARRLLDPAVTSDALELPAGRAIDAARARTAELDTDADAAAERAAEGRYVFMKPMDDATAMVGAVLPAAAALRAYRHLDESARAQRHSGDPRTLDQLRSDAFAAALAGRLCACAASTDSDDMPESALGPRARSGGAGAGTTSVQVVISLASLLGLDSRSAQLDGYGSISAGAARAMIGSGDFTLTRLLCDPDTGEVVFADPMTYSPGARLAHAVRCRDRYCRMPVCSARVQHLDHIQSRADAGLTTSDNLEGLCLRSHLAKHHPGWGVRGDANHTLTWTTPTGREYESHVPPATGDGTGPPGELDGPLRVPGWFSREQRTAQVMQSWLARHGRRELDGEAHRRSA
jgi:hypothetical protein